MSISSIEEGEIILKKHYDSQLEKVKKSCVEKDILWIETKFTHSQRVFKISEFLIENDPILLKLNEKYKTYGKLGALLHDIGRAYEVGDLKAKVAPHGVYGAENILKNLEGENNLFVLLSLKYHDDLYAEKKTREELEKTNLSNDEKEIIVTLLKLVMDSDKLDNFYLFPIVDKKFFLSLKAEPYLTDSCLLDFKNRNLVKREERVTVFDQLLSYITWVYDLNFAASKNLVLKEKYMKNFLYILNEQIELLDKKENKNEILKLKKQLSEINQQLLEDGFLNEKYY